MRKAERKRTNQQKETEIEKEQIREEIKKLIEAQGMEVKRRGKENSFERKPTPRSQSTLFN